MLDLVEGGSTWDEVVALGKAVEAAGATIINTGIGWHEARVPTIATMVPRAAFAWVTRRMKGAVSDPADRDQPDQRPGGGRGRARARRRRHGVDGAAVPRRRGVRGQGGGRSRRRDQHLHRLQPGVPRPDLRRGKVASCLVNPRACHETELVPRAGGAPEARRRRRRGPGGPRLRDDGRRSRSRRDAVRRRRRRSAASSTSRSGFPGKEEFAETLRYYRRRIERTGVALRLGRRVGARATSPGFDHVVLATGIVPRTPAIPGIDHPKVASYVDVVLGRGARRGSASRSSAPAASASTSASS